MGIKRYDGLTPTGTSLIAPGYVLPARQWLNPHTPKATPETIYDATDEEMEIPVGHSGEFHGRLVHIPFGNLSDPDILDCWDGAGKTGNQYTVTFSGSPLGAQTFYIKPGYPFISLPTGLAGTTLYFTYKYVFSGWDMTDAAYVWQAIRDVQLSNSLDTIVCGEAITNKLVYIDNSDGKAYIADEPNDILKQASAFVYGAHSLGDTAIIIAKGKAYPSSGSWTLPKNKVIYAGRNGLPTYNGDVSANALQSGDWAKKIGWSYDGSTILFDGTDDAWIQVP